MKTRDRAFEAGVVADRADAADTGDRAPPSERRGDQQRRSKLVELADVGRAGIPQLSAVTALTAIGTSGQRLVAAVAVMTMSPVSTGCCWRAWSWTAALSVAPGVGCAGCLSVSVVGLRFWANAGVARRTGLPKPASGLADHDSLPLGRSSPVDGSDANPDDGPKEARAASARNNARHCCSNLATRV